jgi:hypothetical protein
VRRRAALALLRSLLSKKKQKVMSLELQALRVVRQHVPTLPLALCSALREPIDALRAVSADNAALCVALSLDPFVIYRIALSKDDVALLDWALDRGVSTRNLPRCLAHAQPATLARLLRRNVRLWNYDCALIDALAMLGVALDLRALGPRLLDALIAARLPHATVLGIMESWWLDAAPRHADYFRELAVDDHRYAAAALLGAGLWRAEHGCAHAHAPTFLRAAVRLERLDAVDAVWPRCAAQLARADAAALWCYVGAPIDEAPTLATYEALLARGFAHADSRLGHWRAIQYHMLRRGDLALTQRLVAAGVWPRSDVLDCADAHRRTAIVEWLAAPHLRLRAFGAALALYDAIGEDDYLQRAEEPPPLDDPERLLPRLAWALLRRRSPTVPLHPALRSQHPPLALRELSLSAYRRGHRLARRDAAWGWLREPTRRIANERMAHSVFFSLPSFAWLLNACAELRGEFPLLLIEACPKPKRRALLECALAHGLPLGAPLAEALARVGDVALLHWLRSEHGCAWDHRCYKAAERFGDAALRRYLDEHEAPRRLRGGGHRIDIAISEHALMIGEAERPFSDAWRVEAQALWINITAPASMWCLVRWGSGACEPLPAALALPLLALARDALLRRGFLASARHVQTAWECVAQL